VSLVVALASSKEALMAGDRRSIVFFGGCHQLEEELYSGEIRDEQELLARARALKATLQVVDGRQKVWRRGDLLVGEVTEISPSRERRRRIYLAPAGYLLVDIEGERAEIKGKGSSGLVVLGNRFAQSLSKERVQQAGGKVDEQLMRAIFEEAGCRTASVSREYDLLSIKAKPQDPSSPRGPQLLDPQLPYPRPMQDPLSSLLHAVEEDARKGGWKLCARQ
jgi:hypothetical protein